MSFVIAIVKNPVNVWDERRECEVLNWNERKGDRHLDLEFDYDDFTALHKYLDLQLAKAERQTDEDYAEFEDRLKNEHIKVAKEKGYEMLGRIWYWYESISYMPSEIEQLFEECTKLKNNAQSPNQITAMKKLTNACKEARKTDSGIFLGSD